MIYHVKLVFVEPVLGTVPKSKNLYEAYILSKRRTVKEGRLNEDEEELSTVPEVDERGWTGFHGDDHGLFVYDYQIKGFLKEAALSTREIHNVKNPVVKVERWVFVSPRRVYFLDGNSKVKEPHGVLERPLRAMTQLGPRVSLVRSDYLEAGVRLEFDLHILSEQITTKMLEAIFDYGKWQGIGQWRGGGYGRFHYKMQAKNEKGEKSEK